MFKAIDTRGEVEIIILDPRWDNQLDHLRALDRQDILVCQECRQPVRVRAGSRFRRRHFAHKHLGNCRYGRESPELLHARALLYEWLRTKFGERATIEKRIDDERLSHAVDCWLDGQEGPVAYWIIEAPMMPRTREGLRAVFAELQVRVNWVLVAGMLREDAERPSGVHLTTTEREFRQRSRYDEPVCASPGSGSLHYLDPDSGILTTYRGLSLVHSPQLYSGRKESRPLSAVLVLPSTGEFVHPGEAERYSRYRLQQAERERKQKEREAKERREAEEAQRKEAEARKRREEEAARQREEEERWRREAEERDAAERRYRKEEEDRIRALAEKRLAAAGYAGPWPDASVERAPTQESPAPAKTQPAAVCVYCGELTTDWWYYDGSTNTCKCRKCFAQKKY